METSIEHYQGTAPYNAFHTALVENVDMIVDALRVVGHELTDAGEERRADFFEQVAGLIETFACLWLAGHDTLRAAMANRSATASLHELCDWQR